MGSAFCGCLASDAWSVRLSGLWLSVRGGGKWFLSAIINLYCRAWGCKVISKEEGDNRLVPSSFRFLRVAQGLEENYLSSFVDVVGNVRWEHSSAGAGA